MTDTSYVICIKIQRDIVRKIMNLSQEAYINKVLEEFQIKDCSPNLIFIVKGDRFHLHQCPKNDLKENKCLIFYMLQLLEV